MNPLKHTPGPWLNGWGKVTDSDGKAICMVIHRKNGDNGNLIASAPDLLRALEWIVDDWERVTNRTLPDDHEAKAAIAKAKGRE